MIVLDKQVQKVERIYGQMSDGSDRQIVVELEWVLTIQDDFKNIVVANFNHDPTDEEITALFPTIPLDDKINTVYADWQKWQAIDMEAINRGSKIDAIQIKVEAAWLELINLIGQMK